MSSIGELLNDRYRLVTLLGRGGMSDVFRAFDERTGSEVAVKIVRSSDAEYATRLSQEARALRRFDHPCLVRLLDSGTNGDMAYLVMDFVDGTSLAQTLRRGPLAPATTASIGSTLADGLAYVHERGVVHRDVKPANILIDTAGAARLADFGIARLVDATTLTIAGTTMGTTSYMAPEQLENHEVGPAADVWSLGIVLLECLTGQRVYAGTPGEVIARRMSGPVPLPPALPVPWKTLLNGMLNHEPSQRLRASEVSTLLATTAFDAPWTTASEAVSSIGAVAVLDNTVLIGAVGDVTTVNVDQTAIIAPLLAAKAAAVTKLPRWQQLIAGVLLLSLVAALVYGLTGDSAPPVPTTTLAPVTTSPTSTTTTLAPTTTTTSGSSQSLTALINDLAAGVTAGTIQNGADQPIAQLANQAVSDAAAGNLDVATSDLQQASSGVDGAVNDGSIDQSVGPTLQSDLAALATSLGIDPTAIAASSTSSVGGGNGNGKGNGD